MSESKPASMRSFFAVVPDSATREHLEAAACAVPLDRRARRVHCASYHLTLAFVGEVAAPQRPLLLEVGGAQRMMPVALRFDAYEYWPKPEVIVAAARTAPQELQGLWLDLHRDLAARGWALDPKRLHPHVTLARKVSQAPVLPALPPFDWLVHDLCLMRSDTSGVQSAYTVLARWSLLDGGVRSVPRA